MDVLVQNTVIFGRGAKHVAQNLLVLNGKAGYSSWQDVRFLKPMSKVFVTQVASTTVQVVQTLPSGTPYNANLDLQRRGLAQVFQQADTFIQAQQRAPLILNGTAGLGAPLSDIMLGYDTVGWVEPPPPWSPGTTGTRTILEVAQAFPGWPIGFGNLDVYDNLNGSMKLAWTAGAGADSYNIYVSGVLVANVPGISAPGVLAGVSGLTVESYTPPTLTQSGTYEFKVVAVTKSIEVAEIARVITVSPTSIATVTPMPRILPYPSRGLN